ncbi:hypothetical protein KEJ18_04965 [Candidatus Bathyarchaeota archaeon]|nr:hypothetical protein [Candidatus Bathyarchaeota archaeon]
MRKPILFLVVAVICVLSGILVYFLTQINNQPVHDDSTSLVSDIQPGVGRGSPPSGTDPNADGPWNHRIMEATSADGLTWIKSNFIVSEQASVPDVIVDENGRVRVYYVDYKNGGISVAIFDDSSWIYKKVVGVTPEWVDPDVVLLPTGEYRLYAFYMAPSVEQHEIYSAISTDGVSFQQENEVRYREESITDPDVIRMGDVWRMFVSKGSTTVSLTSTDGLTFTREAELPINGSVTCTIQVEGGYRIYYHSHVPGKGLCIFSAFSQDGENWQIEGIRLEPGGEGTLDHWGVGDPAVVRMPDGTYRMYYKTYIEPNIPNGGVPPPPISGSFSVYFTNSTYRVAPKNTSGWFITGQDADIMLSGINFNNSGGPLLFNHPGGICSDGTHVLLADTWNNRILIWNSPPEDNTPPDVVLGQKDFYSNNPGIGMDELNWPISVTTDGTHVVVADTYNERILVWNTFPTANGQPADLVLSVMWPWGVWTNGTKLAASSTRNGTVLIWNSFPVANYQKADVFLRGDLGTPRHITSDGDCLIVADHNPRVQVSGVSRSVTFFWKTFPTTNDQPYDFYMEDWMMGAFVGQGKLVLLGSSLKIWNSFPTSASDEPDLEIRQDGQTGSARWIFGGDYGGVAYAGGKMYICSGNGNKIVAFEGVPESVRDPDFVIGAPDLSTNTLETNFFITNPVPASDGNSLFVSSDFDRKLYVWRSLPDESGAYPDVVYKLPEAPWDNCLFNGTLILAGRNSVYIWLRLPLNGELPDQVFTGHIGSVELKDLRGVAYDGKYFYLSDKESGKVYVWSGIPTNETEPKYILNVEQATRLSSDGKYLAVAATEAPSFEKVRIFKISDFASNSSGNGLSCVHINLPQDVLLKDGKLFVADTCNNRVLIWNRTENALEGRLPDVILGEENLAELTPEIGRDKLFWPAGICFDGNYLWIGEFKFSGRILRFSPQ